MNPAKIRKFRIKDISSIMNVLKKSPPPPPLPAYYKNENFFLRLHELFPDFFIISEINEKLVGFTLARRQTRFSNIRPVFISKLIYRLIFNNTRIPPILRELLLSNRGHQIFTAVLPEHRKKGIASAMRAKVLEEMKKSGIKKIDVMIGISNLASIRLAKKFGFKEKKILQDFYGNGKNGLLLEKEI